MYDDWYPTNEQRWEPAVGFAITRLHRDGRDVRRTLYRGLTQRGMPYVTGVGLLDGQVRANDALIWYRLHEGVLHWMAQPLGRR